MSKKRKLDYSQREAVADRLEDRSKAQNGYFLLLILSVIITMLGLLIDSAAIIIGGMIVSPLLNPIMAVGSAIVRGDAKALQKSLLLALRSTVIAILIGLIVTIVSPLKEATPEILTRTSPTLIDLLIALASGTAGAYAFAIKDKFSALIGVVISAAIVPPLAITGYGLAIGEFDLLVGAFLLYLANFIAVISSTVGVFYFLGFRPGRSKESKEEAIRDFAVTFVLLLIMGSILWTFLAGAITQAQRTNLIENEIRIFLKSYSDTELIELTHEDYPEQIIIRATIQSPSSLTQKAINLIDGQLEVQLEKDVNLQVLQIPVQKFADERP